MPQQLCLWSETPSPCQETIPWQDLTPEAQQLVITLLAKLLSTAVTPTLREDNHEQQR